MSWNSRRSLITHPDAILFLRFYRERVFQQPLPISLIDRNAVSAVECESRRFIRTLSGRLQNWGNAATKLLEP